jgi:hypothetical protein
MEGIRAYSWPSTGCDRGSGAIHVDEYRAASSFDVQRQLVGLQGIIDGNATDWRAKINGRSLGQL